MPNDDNVVEFKRNGPSWGEQCRDLPLGETIFEEFKDDMVAWGTKVELQPLRCHHRVLLMKNQPIEDVRVTQFNLEICTEPDGTEVMILSFFGVKR